MGNKPNLERENLIEKVEGLLAMGFTRPTEVLRQERRIKDFQTAKRYLEIARRRFYNRYKKINQDKVLKRELRDLDFMEKRLWINYSNAINSNERTGAINSIIKCKARRAKLLGLDTENVNPQMARTLEDLIKEDDEKEQQTINRGSSVDSGQDGKEGKVQTQSNPTVVRGNAG